MKSVRRTAVLLLAVVSACAVASPRATAEPRKVSVVGGTPIAIESVPWQVFLAIGSDQGCGGSVLDATHVLTAAHCVIPAGQTLPRPASAFKVLAGFTDTAIATPPAGAQVVDVAGVRAHPLYEETTKSDDVAVLTLAKALNLAGARIKPIALAPVGGGPAPGTAVGFSGYGAQIEGRLADGKLYGAALTAVTDDQCRPNVAVNASASVQCVAAGNQAACFGDSGGPLTSGGLQVGVASYAPVGGCGRGPSGFADVTAPEVRAFIDGAAVPVAPRQGDPTLLYSVNPPVQGSPMTCAPGTWANAPALSYEFVNDATGQALQGGASATFIPRRAHLGATVACLVHAANAGGTSTARSGTAAALQRDTVRPNVSLFGVRCRKRRCTVRFGAADPNSQGALKLRVTAKRGKKARELRVKHVNGTTYRAKSQRLPRGRTLIRVRVYDAAGNRHRPEIARRVRIR
jgi:Trypsin